MEGFNPVAGSDGVRTPLTREPMAPSHFTYSHCCDGAGRRPWIAPDSGLLVATVPLLYPGHHILSSRFTPPLPQGQRSRAFGAGIMLRSARAKPRFLTLSCR